MTPNTKADLTKPKSLRDNVAEIMGLTYYDPIDDAISPFAGMWVEEDGKSAVSDGYLDAIINHILDRALAVAPEEKNPKDKFEIISKDGGINISLEDEADDPTGEKNGEMLAHLATFASDTGFDSAIREYKARLEGLRK